jgi:Domain of unknown function (DUF4111)/Nucleotidyltransferase domain
MHIHPVAEEVTSTYLDAVDTEADGLVEGLYLTGSAALGDFRPESSDVDFVAVTAARPDAPARAALERAHARLSHRYRRPWFDGLYVTWDDLARDPALTKECANSHDGRFQSGGGVGDPVTWHTLARHGVACRGPQRGKLKIWSDPGALKQRTLENFDRYWQRLLDQASKSFSLWRMAALTPYAAVWVVLGVTRLHYTLSTGDVCSKKDAASYALQTFPNRWHRIINESLRIREAGDARPDLASAAAEVKDYFRIWRTDDGGPLYWTPFSRRRDVLDYGGMVITDAKRRYTESARA